MKNKVGESILEGSITAVILGLFHDFTKVAGEKGVEILKSKAFGLGTNDEHLYIDAFSYAHEQKIATEAELMKISDVIESHESSQRARIISVIGKEESEVVTETPKLDKDDNIVIDKKTGKVVYERKTEKRNIKGARMLGMLAKLSPEEIKKMLATSGASNSLVFNVKQKANNFVKAVEESELRADGEASFMSETWLERMARQEKARRGII